LAALRDAQHAHDGEPVSALLLTTSNQEPRVSGANRV
jgi:hypothetical protein